MRVRATIAGLSVITMAAAVGIGVAIASPAQATSTDVVINEVYGGGGNTGAPFSRDFVELVNNSGAAVDVSGWSIQYASAAGGSWQVTKLTGSIPAHGLYLVAEAAGNTASQPLPTPDVDGSISMSATAGKVALVTSQTALACGNTCHAAAGVRDYVGYGSAANDSETAPTGTLSNSTSASRTDGADTDDNSADFTVGDPSPANGSSGPVEPPVSAKIHDVQGAAHRSPLTGKRVKDVTGVVTAVSTNGFWMQDPQPDNNPATSEGIFVFTGGAPKVARGNALSVEGKVTEYRPGNDDNNLTTTEIASPKITVTAESAAVPAPTLIGPGGLRAPQAVRADNPNDVESSATFDPKKNALDFYESLEGMLLRVHDATAAGPTNSYGELPVLPGGYGKPRSARGGVLYSYADPNTERLFLTDTLAKIPAVNVGDKLVGDVVGPLDYSFGNFMMAPLATPTVKSGNLQRETTRRTLPGELSVATFNVENLSPVNDQAKFDNLAKVVVDNLRAPDLLAIEEIQDNNGPGKGGVAADQTWARFIAAIKAAGGPAYDYRQIDPVNNTDGGQPDGNIRQGFLFRTDRGLRFVDRPGGDSTTPVTVTGRAGAPHLSASPGRIAPADAAWTASRKPLAGEFTYYGRTLFAIANHFNSKGGDQPLLGRFQPPARPSETQRHAQATLVKGFVDQLQAKDRNAAVVVLGDLNDFQFSRTADILTAGGGLVDLPRTLPVDQRYSYDYEGNSEILDHILVSRGLTRPGALLDYDIVHVNSEFHDQVSDHDPQVVRIRPVLWR
ncbi:lamin tail domain-containing protein [Fodinicola acaciae]|uniref:lamin tail domain-containing protein n=1 Tax=Fodinicola acaciae TaxID=2681555 RepID=UPI001C9E69A3|nr:lamin tail domain-containing protein [Fodinicola acaciae]